MDFITSGQVKNSLTCLKMLAKERLLLIIIVSRILNFIVDNEEGFENMNSRHTLVYENTLYHTFRCRPSLRVSNIIRLGLGTQLLNCTHPDFFLKYYAICGLEDDDPLYAYILCHMPYCLLFIYKYIRINFI